MKNGFEIKRIIKYSSIFDDEKRSLDYYLTGIKRSDMIKATTYFLGFSIDNSKYDEIKSFLEFFFCKENSSLANKIYDKLVESGQIIINALTALQLFEYSFDHLNEEETQEKKQAEVNVFKAILFQNEKNLDAQNNAFSSTEQVDDETKFAAIALTQSFGYSDLINFNKHEIFVAQLIKSIYLFEFLASHPKTQDLLNEYLSTFKCQDWKEYLKRLLPVAMPYVQNDKEESNDIVFMQDSDCEFVENLAIRDDDVIKDFDFRKIRSKPLYNIDDKKYRIIYGLFAIELLHKGVFFKLSEINKNLDQNKKVKGDFRGFYCDEFSEKYLLYNMIEHIYQNKYFKLNGAQIKKQIKNAEPDYYIRNGNNIFLIESKDVLFSAEVKHSYDFSIYESMLKAKFYYDENSNDNKAVLQLITNIKRLLKNQFLVDKNYKPQTIKIYPILILHNSQQNVSGLNVLINYWFQNELTELERNGIDTKRVKPIAIIDIDSLIFHQDAFKNRKIKLEKVLDDYFKYITFDRKKNYKDKNHFNDHVKRTIVPFSIFLTNYLSEKGLWFLPRMLQEKGFSIFN